MKIRRDKPSLAGECAEAIERAFDDFHQEFKEITYRARSRFEKRDWAGAQKDALDRLQLYKNFIDYIIPLVRERMAAVMKDRSSWKKMKREFAEGIAGRDDREIAETFYNSVTRKITVDIGIDPEMQFVLTEPRPPVERDVEAAWKGYPVGASLEDLVRRVLLDCHFKMPFRDLDEDCRLAAERIRAHLKRRFKDPHPDAVEMVKPIFYRSNGAFLVGRIRKSGQVLPLLLALTHPAEGITLDSVLLNDDDVSVVFSFAHSYFHVKAQRPRELVAFLKTIMPLKPVAELYISLGYNKHGKTELYRDLVAHMARSTDRFVTAPGEKGMVMSVFMLPSYDIVFKLIKDRFAYPKKTTRQDVMARYRLVFQHDRVGRLIDAQEFERLTFDKDRFDPALLEELLSAAAGSVTVSGDTVILQHVYTERRLTPMNLYLKESSDEEARNAVIDFGNAIKDLGLANIFPGDVLLKNFGVTRHRRVVFYDYDEICLLTDCNIRRIPPPRDANEELEAEPWFYAGESDVFPEEFRTFMGFPGGLGKLFLERHGDLYTVEYWSQVQERLRRGEIADIQPYRAELRLRP